MTDYERMREVVESAFVDVHRTTPVRLAFAALPDFDDGSRPGRVSLQGAVHVAGRRATRLYYTEPKGESRPVDWHVAEPGGRHLLDSEADVRLSALDRAVTLTQIALWEQRLDPSWPPCPAHPGRHPLGFGAFGDDDAVLFWLCGHGDVVVPVGRLGLQEPLRRRTSLPATGAGALARVVALVLGDLVQATGVRIRARTVPADGDGDVVALSRPEVPGVREVRVVSAPEPDVSGWILDLPPEERPYEVDEEALQFHDASLEEILGRVTEAIDELYGGETPQPPCPHHRGHGLRTDDDGGPTLFWLCPTSGPVAFVGDLGAPAEVSGAR